MARIRIGRVTMKAGGADVRVFQSGNHTGHVAQHMRAWLSGVMQRDREPDAYAAVAFWIDKDMPGHPWHQTTYATHHDSLPLPILVRLAAEQIAAELPSHVGSERAIEAMGGAVESWTPDDAS
jgi:hypothetical protein